MSKILIRSTCLSSMPNSIQSINNFGRWLALPFLLPCDLESMQRSNIQVWTCWVQEYLSPWQVWTKSVHKYLNASEHLSFLMQSVKQQILPLTEFVSLKIVSGCSTSNALSPHQISSHYIEKCVRKWSQHIMLCADLVTLRQCQGHWQWHKTGRSLWCLLYEWQV